MGSEVKLVVFVDGGLVQEIFSNVPAEVLILDQDIDGCDETKRIREWDYKNRCPADETFEVYDREPWDVHVVPDGVEHYFKEMESEVRQGADEVVSEVQETEREGK
jgi:hypothetical protein